MAKNSSPFRDKLVEAMVKIKKSKKKGIQASSSITKSAMGKGGAVAPGLTTGTVGGK